MEKIKKLIGEENKIKEQIQEIDQKLLSSFDKELFSRRGELQEKIELISRAKKLLEDLSSTEEIINTESDPELITLAIEEKKKIQEELLRIEKELEKEEEVGKPTCIVEIRAGVGGEEAALFAGDLFRMYSKFAEKKGWRIKIISERKSDLGGIKEISFIMEGKGVYNFMKGEAGVHRVQRIPVTESGGRIHTSTATVAVLEEPDEIEVKIDPKELEIETFRASGPGGQHVNKTDSAVRIKHIPTGIVVTCQDERSQHMNKEKAMRLLRARIFKLEKEKLTRKIVEERKSQIGTGDRSEKLRTYNFTQNRVTDHRLGVTIYRLEEILDGDLDILYREKKKLHGGNGTD